MPVAIASAPAMARSEIGNARLACKLALRWRGRSGLEVELRRRAARLRRCAARLRRARGLKDRTADVSEVDLALAVRDEHSMRAQEVRAKQHRLQLVHLSRDAAAARRVGRIPEQIRETQRRVTDHLVTDGDG